MVALALSILGCREDPPTPTSMPAPVVAPPPAPPPSVAPIASAKALRGKPKGDAELPTTSGAAYVASLDAQIAGLAKDLKKDATSLKSLPTLRALASAYAVRGTLRGDPDEIQQGIDLASQAIALQPKDAALYIQRAQEHERLHRSRESAADLAQAKKLGGDAAAITEVEQEVDWNLGRYEPAIASIHSAAEKTRTAMMLMREARLAHELGDNETADRTYEAAEDLAEGKSSAIVAQLNFQRGTMKAESGHALESVLFFREAIRRAPTFTAASEGLASTLHALGQDDEAATVYEGLLKASTDPKPAGRLAAIHRSRGKTKEADALRSKATARYEELLKKYPEATFEDAAEFFLGDGNSPSRALDLLEKNLKLRPTSTSYTALARAQLATGDAKAARDSIHKALAMPVESGALFWTAARIYTALGEESKAGSLAKRARSYDARIDKTEPPLK